MEELLIRARNGDQSAIEEIFDKYKMLIRSLANGFFLVGGDKDDLLQEGTLGLFFAINRYDESKGSFPHFAKMCITQRIIYAVRRDSGVGQQALSNYVDLDELAQWSDGATPLETLLHKEFVERATHAVDKILTATERSVLKLFAEGYTYEEIADKLGRSAKSVDGALQRARKKLAEYLN